MKAKKCKFCGKAIFVSGWKIEPANKTDSSLLKQPLYFDNLDCLKRWVEMFDKQKIQIDKLIDSIPLK